MLCEALQKRMFLYGNGNLVLRLDGVTSHQSLSFTINLLSIQYPIAELCVECINFQLQAPASCTKILVYDAKKTLPSSLICAIAIKAIYQ